MKELKAADKVTQKMTHDGAVQENLATGEMANISSREAETDFSASEEPAAAAESAAEHTVNILKDGGFLTMDEDHYLHLTNIGREIAEKIYERHCFFTEQLIAAGVDPKTAEADACRIEHVISSESFARLKEAAEQEQD